MTDCNCDNCNNIIYFNSDLWRNGDIYCPNCFHLYKDDEKAELMNSHILKEDDE
ncbi:TPA_asm: hypothetical protein GZX19_10300 [Listeria monocytogenes]|nr:hypothetical protein [Listeria monocytogenes]